MDFTDASLLIAAVFAIVALIDKAVPQIHGWQTQAIAFAVGIAATFLVAYSSYADTVTIAGKSLADVNTGALILIGLMIAGGATLVDRTFGSISNIGQNHE